MEGKNTFPLLISTPYGPEFDGEVSFLLLTTPHGDRGIRRGHENALFYVGSSEVIFERGDESTPYKVEDGVFIFEGGRAVLAAKFAAPSGEYDARRREHLLRMEQRYSQEQRSEADLQRAQMAMRRSLVQNTAQS